MLKMSSRFQEESGSVSPLDNSSDEGKLPSKLGVFLCCLVLKQLWQLHERLDFIPSDTEDASEGESDSKLDSSIASGKGR